MMAVTVGTSASESARVPEPSRVRALPTFDDVGPYTSCAG